MANDEATTLLDDFENKLDRLRATYEQYFLGFERTEPAVQRKEVERRLEVLRKMNFRATATRFRYQTLVSRYTTFCDYWRKTCRAIEEGTYRRDVLKAKKLSEKLNRQRAREEREEVYELDENELQDFEDVEQTAADAGSTGDFDEDELTRTQPTPDFVSQAQPAHTSAAERRQAPAVSLELDPSQDFASKNPASPTGRFAVPVPTPSTAVATPAMPAASGAGNRVVPSAAQLLGRSVRAPSDAKAGPTIPPAGTAIPAEPQLKPAINPAPVANTPSVAPPPTGQQRAVPSAMALLSGTAARPPVARAPGQDAPPPARPAPAKPAPEENGMRDLYDRYRSARMKNGEGDVPFELLAKQVRETLPRLEEKYPGQQVSLDVVVKDGRTILRPVVKPKR